MTGSALVLQANALHLPLPDESVDLVVTSPPYWSLRAYDAPESQVGSEPTPQEYLAALWAATAEMARVLKPSGSIFVDLGDKYGRPGGGADVSERSLNGAGQGTTKRLATPAGVGRGKCLMLLPERYRVGCVDHLGLIARAVIVWNKPNGLPESVTDRVRRSHEDWVHLVKQPRYYSATDEVREPHAPGNQGRSTLLQHRQEVRANGVTPLTGGDKLYDSANPLGKLPGSVWSIPSEPLRLPEHLGVQHYAAFPSEWPRRLILGWSPPGICLDCGQGRVPVVDKPRLSEEGERLTEPATILGYACPCAPRDQQQPPTRPAVVLDPFSGTGTTAMVARALGRIGVGVDLSHAYCRAACWRVHNNAGKAIRGTNAERQGSLL